MRACVLLVVCLIAVVDGTPAFSAGIEKAPLDFQSHKGAGVGSQLQPEDHNVFQHGGQNFFEHEIIYVENHQVLIFHPTSGQWALHSLSRTCGEDCPIIQERPVSSGQWDELRYRKLVFLGCHASTGHGHLLSIDTFTGNYSIHYFDHSAPNPLGEEAAAHSRLEMTQFRVAYMGRDDLLLHDGQTDEYELYLVEPRLPISKGTDPIGPFDPLDNGKISLREQVVYLGDNWAMDYSGTTGEYTVYLYDRGATGSEPPFTHVLAEGTIDNGLQLTYLGEHQLLCFDPFRGDFKVLNLMSETFIAQPPKYYGFGSVLVGGQCRSQHSCASCIAREGCGWCETLDECFRGDLEAPCATNCTLWETHACPGEPCESHRGCTACLRDPFCGWCADLEVCTEGTIDGPLFGGCAYSKLSCPVVRVQSEAGCEGEIQ